MSIKVMSMVWEREGLSPTHRLILLALADHADDDGVCYPSIARLRRRTGLSERAIQTAFSALCAAGWLRIERNAGPRGCNVFTVSTPAADAPPQQMHPRRKCAGGVQHVRPTPAADAPEPSRTIKEPSVDNARALTILTPLLGEECARDWLDHRKAKRAKMTPRACELLVAKLSAMPDPRAAIYRSIENGWTGVFEPPGQKPAANVVNLDFSKYGI